ncbi:39S ribosomal protein L35, mitochondrial [Anopheles darlingi]|uniref:50S ribosomal protein L35 n=1 Tax=Anopheles darlingi TaxID=43151 RepID=W5JDZ0_ANODA|nr:39S ribosomal protein L35, mitochondrial [Anopheles darlingi]
MLRNVAVSAFRRSVLPRVVFRAAKTNTISTGQESARSFSTILRNNGPTLRSAIVGVQSIKPSQPLGLLDAVQACPQLQTQPCRTVIKFSMRKGKRKTVKAVVKRFKRLDWGGWIRTLSGRHKKLWRKKANRKRRLRQHVLVNATQATLLDKMVTKYWKRPRHYINDPYAPYHTREEFVYTRRKALK